MRSEASGLAGAAREPVAEESDIVWRGEEGPGSRRGPERAAPAPAPFLSPRMGSRRLESISVEEAMVTRTKLLEEELSSLKEELALCQVSRILARPSPSLGAARLRGFGTHSALPGDAPSGSPQPAGPAARGFEGSSDPSRAWASQGPCAPRA